ncbi:MAG: pyruvate formate lyase family protein, partial [Anaerolineae bacterium]|nr:pyruvate formate lyase family protein [Anaerolineae bacterium]
MGSNNDNVASEPTYQQRIEALRQTKKEHTALKVEMYGHFDTDDHGYIPWPDPVPFEPEPNHPDGGCYGARCIGENFRRWLEVHPIYIHPMSSIAGAWIYRQGIPGLAGWHPGKDILEAEPETPSYPRDWKPEDRPTHLLDLHRKYNTYSPGIGNRNHFGPDMMIGFELGWGGLLEKIRRYRRLNRPLDTSFYDAEENLVLGIQEWIRRHVAKAREMAAEEQDPTIRDSLLKIAEVNAYLVDGAPRTFHEACQFLACFQTVDRMWGLGGAMGQLDELLLPYYEDDIAA